MNRIPIAVPCLMGLALLTPAFRVKPKQAMDDLSKDMLAEKVADVHGEGTAALHVASSIPDMPVAKRADEVAMAAIADVAGKISSGEVKSVEDVKGLISTVGLIRSGAILSTAAAVLPASWFTSHSELEEVPSHSAFIEWIDEQGRFAPVPISIAVALVLTLLLRAALGGGTEKAKDAQADGSGAVAEVVDDADFGSICSEGFTIGAPVVIMAMLVIMNETVSTVCLGRVGSPAELSAVGLTNMMFNCTFYSFGNGIAGVLDTLVSQAWGAGNDRVCLIYLQRCRLVSFLQILWMAPLLWFAQPILLFLGQDPEVVSYCGFVCKINIPSAVICSHYLSTISFLRNRGDVLPSVWVLLIGNIVHICCCILFVIQFRWGIKGIAFAELCNHSSTWLSLQLYFRYKSDVSNESLQTLFGWQWSTFRQLGGYLRLAVPSVISTCSEFWYWEINTLMLGIVGKIALASHIGANNFANLLSMATTGVNQATGTVVGRAVGGHQAMRAKATAYAGCTIAIGFWLISSLLLIVFRSGIAYAYSNDEQVQALMANLFIILAFSQFFNVTQGVAAGALRGIAMQKMVAVTQFCSYYIFGLGLAMFLTFYLQFGVYGVYYGWGSAAFLLLFLFSIILMNVDWPVKVREANERIGAEGPVQH